MPIRLSPFTRLDHAAVVASLVAIGSRDPDAIHARRACLLARARFPKVTGLALLLVGVGVAVSEIGAAVGLPFVILGAWMAWRGARNLRAVESGWSEFLRGGA